MSESVLGRIVCICAFLTPHGTRGVELLEGEDMRYGLVVVALLLLPTAVVLSGDPPDSQTILELRQRIEGTNWSEVGSTEQSDGAWLFSVDPSRYEGTDKGYVLWLRSDRKPDGYVERLGNYDRFVQHLEIDCKKRRQRVMRAIFYSGPRTLNPKEKDQAGLYKWIELVPGTMGDATADAICKALSDLDDR